MTHTPKQQAWLDRMSKLNAAMDEAGRQFEEKLSRSGLPLCGGAKPYVYQGRDGYWRILETRRREPDDLDWVGSLQSYEWGE